MLAIEPAAGPTPVVQVIEQAQHRVDLNVYDLTSHAVANALKADCERGVDVRVILEMHPYGGDRIVKREKKLLKNDCIQLKAPPP